MPDIGREEAAAVLSAARRDPAAAGPYLRPFGFLSGAHARAAVADGTAMALAGGPLAFSFCDLILRRDGLHRDGGRRTATVAARDLSALSGGVQAEAAQAGGPERILDAVVRPRADFAGVPLKAGDAGSVVLMGILNVTPDSFSDGGRYTATDDAVARGVALAEAGAAIIDVGGESTRPGAEPVPLEAELDRVIPVVRELTARELVVSIDTRKPEVMKEALVAGALIVNDVTALSDPESLRIVAERKASAILMHMQGDPATMQKNPVYRDAALDVYDFLAGRIRACEAAGIPASKLVVDPGIGFGKTKDHNAEILASLSLYHGLGCGLMIGVSRKGFVGGAEGRLPPASRLPGSLAAGLASVRQGVQMLRVHDVAETRQALAVWDAIDAADRR